MQVKQYNLKVFEITVEDREEFEAFIRKNKLLLKRYLLLLRGQVTPEVEALLRQEGLAYTQDPVLLEGHGAATAGAKRTAAEPSERRFARRSGLEIVDTLVRSGTAVGSDRDMLILKRVNSGATVETDGNLIALAPIEGLVKCNGDFMLIKPTGKARILFNGVDVTDAMQTDHFYKIRMAENEIVITPYAKDIQWA
jgi:septum site-determining protein MinC